VPTIFARRSEGSTGFINALFFALGVVFCHFDLHSSLPRLEIRDHRILMQVGDVHRHGLSLRFRERMESFLRYIAGLRAPSPAKREKHGTDKKNCVNPTPNPVTQR
jgi:hypothetical protein